MEGLNLNAEKEPFNNYIFLLGETKELYQITGGRFKLFQ